MSTVWSRVTACPVDYSLRFGSGCYSTQIVLKLFLSRNTTYCSLDTYITDCILSSSDWWRQAHCTSKQACQQEGDWFWCVGVAQNVSSCPWIRRLDLLFVNLDLPLEYEHWTGCCVYVFDCGDVEALLSRWGLLENVSHFIITNLPRNPSTFPLKSIMWSPNFLEESLGYVSEAWISGELHSGSFWRVFVIFDWRLIDHSVSCGYTLYGWIKGEILVFLEVPLFAPVANSGLEGIFMRRIVVMH